MTNALLKIKVWTKIVVFGLIALLAIVNLASNWETTVPIKLVFVYQGQPRLLFVLFFTAVFSVFGWWLFRTALKTFRQINEVRQRSRLEKLEKENAEMVAKAARLQTRPEGQ